MKWLLLSLGLLAAGTPRPAHAAFPPYIGYSVVTSGKVTQYVSGDICVAASSATAGACVVDISGTTGITGTSIIGSTAITDGAITSTKLASSAVTTPKVGSDAITSDKILNAAVTTPKLSPGAVDTTKILADAVTSEKILDAAVTTNKLASGATTSAKIAVDAVTAVKILNTAVTTSKLATDSVTTTAILNGTITAAKLGFSVGVGDMLLASTQTVSGQKNITSNTVYGTSSNPSSVYTSPYTKYGISDDGITESSGCIVWAYFQAGAVSSDTYHFTSTTSATTAFFNGRPAMLLETCAPGSTCLLGMGSLGEYFAQADATGIASADAWNFSGATRCRIAQDTTLNNNYMGNVLTRTSVPANGFVWINFR